MSIAISPSRSKRIGGIPDGNSSLMRLESSDIFAYAKRCYSFAKLSESLCISIVPWRLIDCARLFWKFKLSREIHYSVYWNHFTDIRILAESRIRWALRCSVYFQDLRAHYMPGKFFENRPGDASSHASMTSESKIQWWCHHLCLTFYTKLNSTWTGLLPASIWRKPYQDRSSRFLNR